MQLPWQRRAANEQEQRRLTCYSVLIHGQGFSVTFVDRVLWIFKRRSTRRMGVYVVRFLDAPSPRDAAEQALPMVYRELLDALPIQDPCAWHFAVEEVREGVEPEVLDGKVVQPGFMWYPEGTE